MIAPTMINTQLTGWLETHLPASGSTRSAIGWPTAMDRSNDT